MFYLDVCCLNRPFDDQHQVRVRIEAEAVLALMGLTAGSDFGLVSSEVVELEADQNPDAEIRSRVWQLLTQTRTTIRLGPTERRRGIELQTLGFGAFDALHLACAEAGQAEVLLTTDDRLRNRARKHEAVLGVRVENPATWYTEVITT